LSDDGVLNSASRLAQEIGRQYCIPVFLKTFGSDEAYTIGQDDDQQTVLRIGGYDAADGAASRNISGVAWSIDEAVITRRFSCRDRPVHKPAAARARAT